MYPDLSYFFNDLFGTDVDNWTSIFKTFGFMLVIALASCGILLRHELLQKEKEGLILPLKIKQIITEKLSIQDILINSMFSLFIGAKLPVLIMKFDEFKGDPASFVFSKIGMWWLGILAAIGLQLIIFGKIKKRIRIPKYQKFCNILLQKQMISSL